MSKVQAEKSARALVAGNTSVRLGTICPAMLIGPPLSTWPAHAPTTTAAPPPASTPLSLSLQWFCQVFRESPTVATALPPMFDAPGVGICDVRAVARVHLAAAEHLFQELSATAITHSVAPSHSASTSATAAESASTVSPLCAAEASFSCYRWMVAGEQLWKRSDMVRATLTHPQCPAQIRQCAHLSSYVPAAGTAAPPQVRKFDPTRCRALREEPVADPALLFCDTLAELLRTGAMQL